MKHRHHIIFSYDQKNVTSYKNNNFRVDLLKSLLRVKNVDQNSFKWWVETTITFVIVNDTPNKSPLSSIKAQIIKDKLEPHMNYFMGLLQNYNNGSMVKLAKANTKGEKGFLDDVKKAKNELAEEKKNN